MGSKDKFFSITSADKGTDDIGLLQASGTISAIGDAKTASGRWSGKLLLTINSSAKLLKGQPINITNLDADHNGLTRVLAVVSATKIIVNKTYVSSDVDATGNWDVLGGASAWDAMMPIGANLTAANIILTFWDPNKEGGEDTLSDFLSGKVYVFPGIIKTALIATAGNVRLFRAATLRPFGKDAQ